MSSSPLTRITAAVTTVLLALTLVGVSAGSAQASASARVAVNTQRMTDATLNSTQVGWYTKNSTLQLVCYKRGQSVQGYFSPWFPGGWDNLWYKVSDGYFVADIDIDTGSNNPVTGACSDPTPPTPPTPTTSTARVMATTQRQVEATLNSTQAGWYAKNSTITLVCYKRGQAVKGYFSPYVGNGGWDDLWYRVSDGYFVADVDIETGSNNPVTVACTGSTPTPPTTPTTPGPTGPIGKVMVQTQKMSGASLQTTQAGWYAKGSSLWLVCYVRGQAVRGYFSSSMGGSGWDNLWYRVSDGYYVADVDIDTGSNNPVTSVCPGSSPTTPPATSNPPPSSPIGTGTCAGQLCEGRDPNKTNCVQDARTISSQMVVLNGTYYGVLDIRYSPKCYANWARYTPFDGPRALIRGFLGGFDFGIPYIWMKGVKQKAGPVPGSYSTPFAWTQSTWTTMISAAGATCASVDLVAQVDTGPPSGGLPYSSNGDYDRLGTFTARCII